MTSWLVRILHFFHFESGMLKVLRFSEQKSVLKSNKSTAVLFELFDFRLSDSEKEQYVNASHHFGTWDFSKSLFSWRMHMPTCSRDETSMPKWLLPKSQVLKWLEAFAKQCPFYLVQCALHWCWLLCALVRKRSTMHEVEAKRRKQRL